MIQGTKWLKYKRTNYVTRTLFSIERRMQMANQNRIIYHTKFSINEHNFLFHQPFFFKTTFRPGWVPKWIWISEELNYDTIENKNKKEPLGEASNLKLKANPIGMTWRDREMLFGTGFHSPNEGWTWKNLNKQTRSHYYLTQLPSHVGVKSNNQVAWVAWLNSKWNDRTSTKKTDVINEIFPLHKY